MRPAAILCEMSQRGLRPIAGDVRPLAVIFISISGRGSEKIAHVRQVFMDSGIRK
jgi:hypothetical protein